MIQSITNYTGNTPLVSAIMPTRGRQAFAKQALECWFSQEWPNKELIIYDDKEDRSFRFSDKFKPPGVRDYAIPGRLTIGEKRNLCCTKAQGEYIVHFDSDDWSSPDRITDQMARIQASGKAVTGYDRLLFTDESSWWRYEGQIFSGFPKGVNGVFGTSLLYRRDWWEAHRFVNGPKKFKGYEDQAFVETALREGQLAEFPAGDRMFARIHSDNSSPKGTSDRARFQPVTDPAILGPIALKRNLPLNKLLKEQVII